MNADLITYILTVADGDGPPSIKQWANIVDMARGTQQNRIPRRGTQADLRPARILAGISQAQLADKIGTTQQTIMRLEAGQTSHSRYLKPALAAVGVELSQDGLSQSEWLGGRPDLLEVLKSAAK